MIQRLHAAFITPFTWPQRLGIVSSNSYGAIVKPTVVRSVNPGSKQQEKEEHTIDLIVVFHEGKRIKIDIAVKVDVRPAKCQLS